MAQTRLLIKQNKNLLCANFSCMILILSNVSNTETFRRELTSETTLQYIYLITDETQLYSTASRAQLTHNLDRLPHFFATSTTFFSHTYNSHTTRNTCRCAYFECLFQTFMCPFQLR